VGLHKKHPVQQKAIPVAVCFGYMGSDNRMLF